MGQMKTLIQSEFYVASGYLDRLLFTFIDLSDFSKVPSGTKILIQVRKNIYTAILDVLHEKESDELSLEPFDHFLFRAEIKTALNWIEQYLFFPLNRNESTTSLQLLNTLYAEAFRMHQYLYVQGQFEIQYPRPTLAEEESVSLKQFLENKEGPEGFQEGLKKFSISNEVIAMQSTQANDPSQELHSLQFLNRAREKKYQHFLHLGHKSIANKKYADALKHFFKASHYIENGEINTLIAWSYSFLNDFENAKNFCLKSMKRDPDYGPAYNDYGNYLLLEGKMEDALRFFAMAKKAVHYQNREYPYINTGRVFMQMHRYEEALEEFSYALTYAPYHEELHETVRKLKASLKPVKNPIFKKMKPQNESLGHETNLT